jgi:predicted phage terminase large subunit-like protein
MARYPDCNYLYTSHAYSLAAKQTRYIRDILSLREYRDLFHVELDRASSAKHDFETMNGGSVYAAGVGGGIVGRGAGVRGCKDRFSGCIFIDDAHKPSEALSDVIRESTIEWYHGTLYSRLNNGADTPVIAIGQRLHENDLLAHLYEEDGDDWTLLSIPVIDQVGNVLHPEIHGKEELLKMQKTSPYDFAGQYMQNPQPPGGGIYKKDDFVLLDEEPNLLATFITADTAETDKDYNDATVFSFWGIYKIKHAEFETNLYGLQWIDCVEIRIEPKDLQPEFMQFYYSCLRHKVPPTFAAIEKKSTGVTLSSTLSAVQGLEIMKIERTKASGNKAARFIEIQKYVAGGYISFLSFAKHKDMCIDHCSKITTNDTHRHDDIADTMYDAIKLALIDEVLIKRYIRPRMDKKAKIIQQLVEAEDLTQQIRGARYERDCG